MEVANYLKEIVAFAFVAVIIAFFLIVILKK